MAAESLFNNYGVQVTEKLVTINGETYSVSNINSIKIVEEKQSNWIVKVIVFIVVLFLVNLLTFLSPIFFFLALGLAWFAASKFKVGILYYLNFVTSAGQTPVFHSKDKKQIEEIKNAIQIAMGS